MKLNRDKKNLIFRLTCFLLVVTSFTCISLAKYISARQIPVSPEIGALRCSINVQLSDNETMIPFSDSEYLINNSPMNIPQRTSFLVNNCDLDENGNYSEKSAGVDLKYDLIFYVPVDFAMIAAMQLERRNKNKEYVAVTQLYILEEFIKAGAGSGSVTVIGDYKAYNAQQKDETKKKIDYGSLFYGEVKVNEATGKEEKIGFDETFTLSSNDNAQDSSMLWLGDKETIILIDEVTKDAKLNYAFQTFDKEPTSEYERYEAPIYVTKRFPNLKFYKITISRPDFVLKGGSRQDDDYYLRMITTGQMTKSNVPEEIQQDALHTYTFAQFYNGVVPDDGRNYVGLKNLSADDYTMTWEGVPCTLTEQPNKDGVKDGKMWALTLKECDRLTELKKDPDFIIPTQLFINPFIQKSYPVRINATFTQTKKETHENV